jgi:hypothetical protein
MGFRDQYPERDGVMPRGWAPLAVRKFIRQVGGLNPYGEANYRLVLAQSIYELHGGRWIDWPAGLSLQQMGGAALVEEKELKHHVLALAGTGLPAQELVAEVRRLVPSAQRPLRTVEEMRLVQRYPHHEGWMLQCWRPPDQFGSRQWWESQTVPGRPDLPILGPFPQRGDYEAIDHIERGENGIEISRTTYRELPDLTGLEHAIQFLEDQKYREREGASPEARILIRVHDYERQLEANRKKSEADRSMYLTELLKPYLGNSLEAGRLRTEAAKDAGITRHVGN